MAQTNLDDAFPRASASTRRLNPGLFSTHGLASVPQPEPTLCDGIQETPRCQTRFTTRVLVRITSYRCQPADPDNICVKHMVDCLRHSRIIRNDRKEDIDLQVTQEKVKHRKEERTEILVIPLD